MWFVTTFGFFSAVQKHGEELLTVRARSAAVLDRLRDRYLSELGPTESGTGTDYPHRARVHRDALASAMAEMARDVTYANFKSAVGAELGSDRARTYHDVWSALLAIEDEAGAGGSRS